ncbi:DBF4-like protein A [Heterocephalus glaber]|uniref:DBF4-like protein A n=1 Tax=Heterocephalus glaber TaxID=10181 RepID=G5B2N2_HETGA|nr:DBF4-like protein A [Heterocephalus glaber]
MIGLSGSHTSHLDKGRAFYTRQSSRIRQNAKKPCSPFDVDKPASIQKQDQVKLRIHTDGDKCGGSPVHLQLKEKKKKDILNVVYRNMKILKLTYSVSSTETLQSTKYQVVDNIVSKLVFDFVEDEKDTPKKKRIKYSVGSLSLTSSNVHIKTESKERLDLQHISQKDFREDNVQMIKQTFLDETQEPNEKFVFISEPIPFPSNELKGLNEKMINECSMLNAAENDTKQSFTQLLPCKNKEDCILDIPEHELIVNENPSSLQTSVKVSPFKMNNNVSYP